jgi:hypothetical protein
VNARSKSPITSAERHAKGRDFGGGFICRVAHSRPKAKRCFLDGLFHGHFTSAQKLAHERMAAHEEQMKNQNCQAESVVIRVPHHPFETLTLKFWRRILWYTHLTRKEPTVPRHLIRIAVD